MRSNQSANWTSERLGAIKKDQNSFYQEFKKSGLTLAEFVRTIKYNEYLMNKIESRAVHAM